MKKINLKQPFLLVLTAFIWGIAFVAQSVSMDYIGPFTFNCVRNLIGGLVLLPCIALLNRITPDATSQQLTATPEGKRTLLRGGLACGMILFAASNLQQIGIQYTTVGKAGFITALYIILVPIFSLFLKKKCGVNVWIGVFLALIGFYLLTMKGSFSLSSGDLLVLLGSVVFTLHILVIDYFSPRTDGVKMSCIQFFVCGILSGVMMLLTEEPHIPDILAAWQPVLYAGVLSCGVAYTLQIIGQRNFNPTIASLLLSLESVFSVLAGWLLLGEVLSAREIMGCVLIFAAILLAQIPMSVFAKHTK